MPRRFPCAGGCGYLMWHGSGSLPPGQATCHACRRRAPSSRKKSSCVDCGEQSYGIRCRKCRDIQQRSGQTPEDIRERRRTLERRRRERERQAPGLSASERNALREIWIRRSRVCAYCQSRPATQIDHVIPLALGGTNYEGNLTPCCAECNRAKSESLLMEWRLGKRPRRMRWTVRVPRVTDRPEPKPRFCKIYFGTCIHCAAPFAGRNYRVNTCIEHRSLSSQPFRVKVDCCTECGSEFSGRLARVYCSDTCARRASKRKYRQSPAGRAERRRYEQRRRERIRETKRGVGLSNPSAA